MDTTNFDAIENMRDKVEEELIEIDHQIQICLRSIDETEKYIVSLTKSEANSDRFFSPRVDDTAFKNEIQQKKYEIDCLESKILTLRAKKIKIQEKAQELEKALVKEKMNQLTISIQERDRKRIAKRLDEDTFIGLSKMKELLKNSEEAFFIHPVKAKDYLTEAIQLLESVSERTADILFDIHPSVFGYFDLQKALTDLPNKIIHIDNCKVSVQVENVSCETFYTIMNIYYIVQECLENINEHSCAKNVSFVTKIEDNKYLIDIVDDGIGFEYKANKLDANCGLKLMKDRVAVLNGTIDITTKHKEGTSIHIVIPIP